MHATTLIACAVDGAVYCPEHCPNPDACETDHGAIFPTTEVDCSPDSCDECGVAIDDETVIHNYRRGACEYCGDLHECDFGPVSVSRITGTASRACECGMVSLDIDGD